MPRKRKIDSFNKILNYIDYQFGNGICEKKPVTVARVAQYFGVTTRHLERLFRDHCHVSLSPKEYIRLLQFIYAAKHTSLDPAISMKELKYKLGIRSRVTLEMITKKFVKTTPKKYWNPINNARRMRVLIEEIKMSHF